MEQRTLPQEENNARLDTPDFLMLETAQHWDLLPHTIDGTSETCAAERLGAEFSQRIHKNQKREGRAIWSIPVFYSLMTVLLFLGKALLGDERTTWITSPLFYVPVVLFWLGITGFMIGSIVKPRKRLRPLAQMLAGLHDVRAAGSLIDTLKLEDRKIHAIAIESLIELLPRLTASDIDLLNAEQRTLLCWKLSSPPNRFDGNLRPLSQTAYEQQIAFRIAILQAFAQVGDSRALPIVERLARGETKTEEQKRIQKAARECLPLLKLRIEQQRSIQTLLRASDASHADPETLLRPMKGAQETHPEQLLRPGPPIY
ncbi:MAG: hypothetical protein JWL77_4022 [Chthonomonadaceae bacterium]|nr:hypothetical protein [Chthonomonadaceae bacterium]